MPRRAYYAPQHWVQSAEGRTGVPGMHRPPRPPPAWYSWGILAGCVAMIACAPASHTIVVVHRCAPGPRLWAVPPAVWVAHRRLDGAGARAHRRKHPSASVEPLVRPFAVVAKVRHLRWAAHSGPAAQHCSLQARASAACCCCVRDSRHECTHGAVQTHPPSTTHCTAAARRTHTTQSCSNAGAAGA